MFGFYVFKYFWYSIIFISIGVAGFINQKYIETIFILATFFTLRYAFPKTFHHKDFYSCIALSIGIFWVAIPHTISISISLFGSVVVGFIMTYILYLIQDYIDKKKYYLQHTSFNVETATDEQIESIGKILHYKRDKIDLAKKFFVEKLSNKQVLEWLCEKRMNVEYDTVIQYRYRILKDIKKFEKKQ